MRSNIQRAIFVLLFSMMVGAGSLAWAAHGYGGGGRGYGHYGGYSGFNHYGGGGVRFHSGFYGSPFGYSYRPYANYYRPSYYGYGVGYPFGYRYGYYNYPYSYYGDQSYSYSYPGNYYTNGDDDDYGNVVPPTEYRVSRPVTDIARMEVRLPDPQAKFWVDGKEMTTTGTVRHFKSPQLDPSRQFTYNVKAEWNDNGNPVTESRQVKVQANGLAVVDFNKPSQVTSDAQRPAVPDLPAPQIPPQN